MTFKTHFPVSRMQSKFTEKFRLKTKLPIVFQQSRSLVEHLFFYWQRVQLCSLRLDIGSLTDVLNSMYWTEGYRFKVYLVEMGLKALALSSSFNLSVLTSCVGDGERFCGGVSLSFFSVLIREGVEFRTTGRNRNRQWIIKHQEKPF